MLTYAPTHQNRAGGGLSEKRVRIRPEHRKKAEAFWNALAEKRKLPGHCCRCGKPHGGQFRQCDPCRVRVANAKAKRQAKALTLAQCFAMVKQCRKEVTKLREIIKAMQRSRHAKYQQGYLRGLTTGREQGRYGDTLHELTTQELAAISHRFDRED